MYNVESEIDGHGIVRSPGAGWPVGIQPGGIKVECGVRGAAGWAGVKGLYRGEREVKC